MTKKGGIGDLFIFSTVIVCLVILSALMLFITGTIKDGLLSHADVLQKGITNRNVTDDINLFFGAAETSFKATNTYIMFVFIALVLSFFISNAFIKTNPYWFAFYAFVVGIAIVFAIGIKRAYFQLATKEALAPYFAEMTKPEWIINYFPIIITAVGFIGGILLFVRMNMEESY